MVIDLILVQLERDLLKLPPNKPCSLRWKTDWEITERRNEHCPTNVLYSSQKYFVYHIFRIHLCIAYLWSKLQRQCNETLQVTLAFRKCLLGNRETFLLIKSQLLRRKIGIVSWNQCVTCISASAETGEARISMTICFMLYELPFQKVSKFPACAIRRRSPTLMNAIRFTHNRPFDLKCLFIDRSLSVMKSPNTRTNWSSWVGWQMRYSAIVIQTPSKRLNSACRWSRPTGTRLIQLVTSFMFHGLLRMF